MTIQSAYVEGKWTFAGFLNFQKEKENKQVKSIRVW